LRTFPQNKRVSQPSQSPGQEAMAERRSAIKPAGAASAPPTPQRSGKEKKPASQRSSPAVLWPSQPQVIPPKYMKQLSIGMDEMDLVLGAVSWAVPMKRKALGLLALARAASHLFRIQVSWSDERKGVWVVVSYLFFAFWKRIINKLGGKHPRLAVLDQGFAWLGVAQVLLWCTVHPETIFGIALGSLWHSVRMIMAFVAPKIGLEGTLAYSKRQFPATKEAISPSWLQAQLSRAMEGKDVPPFDVASCDIIPLSGFGAASSSAPQGFIGECVRIKLVYSGKGKEHPSLPKSLIAKLPTQSFEIKLRLRALGLYYREVRFFTDFAPKLLRGNANKPMLRVPNIISAEYDDRMADFILLMEDLGALEPGDELKGASWQQACSVALRYARFHALHWSSSLEELDEKHQLGWQRCFDWIGYHPLLVDGVIQEALNDIATDERYSKYLTPGTQQTLRDFAENIQLVLAHLKRGPMTLVHGDCRMENMMWPLSLNWKPMDKELVSNPAFDDLHERQRTEWFSLDWQTSTKGVGVGDLSYFVTLDLDVDASLGPKCDKVLCEAYYKEVAECLTSDNGVQMPNEEDGGDIPGYSFEACWNDYCLSTLLAALVPVAVLRPSVIGESTRGIRVRQALLERALRAIARVDAASALSMVIREERIPRVMEGVLAKYRQVEDEVLGEESSDCVVVSRKATAQDENLAHITPQVFVKLQPGISPKPGHGRRDTYDRWFLNGYDASSRSLFALALGAYPGRRVVDASFVVVVNGKQTNVRSSRVLTEAEWPSHYELSQNEVTPVFQAFSCVGPIKITVLRPLEKIQLIISIPGTMAAELTCICRYAPCMEPPYVEELPNIGKFNYDRFTQLVEWKGSIQLGAEESIVVEDWFGVRDRSWGTRPHPIADLTPMKSSLRSSIVGYRLLRTHALNPLMYSSAKTPQFYWFWAPIHFQCGGILYHSQQNASGEVTNGAATILGDPFSLHNEVSSIECDPYGRVERAGHTVHYIVGTRHAQTAKIVLALQDGRRITLDCEPLGVPLYMSGLGYNHPQWAHGSTSQLKDGKTLAVGVDHIASNIADRTHPDRWHVQDLCRVTAKLFGADAGTCDEPIAICTGFSAVEQLVVGPHRPSAFQTLYDVA